MNIQSLNEHEADNESVDEIDDEDATIDQDYLDFVNSVSDVEPTEYRSTPNEKYSTGTYERADDHDDSGAIVDE